MKFRELVKENMESKNGKKSKEKKPPLRRCLGITAAAVYAGVSRWTVQDWLDADLIPVVYFPTKGGKALRRRMIDMRDLDTFIEMFKDRK